MTNEQETRCNRLAFDVIDLFEAAGADTEPNVIFTTIELLLIYYMGHVGDAARRRDVADTFIANVPSMLEHAAQITARVTAKR
jgi:hypothetical protein